MAKCEYCGGDTGRNKDVCACCSKKLKLTSQFTKAAEPFRARSAARRQEKKEEER